MAGRNAGESLEQPAQGDFRFVADPLGDLGKFGVRSPQEPGGLMYALPGHVPQRRLADKGTEPRRKARARHPDLRSE